MKQRLAVLLAGVSLLVTVFLILRTNRSDQAPQDTSKIHKLETRAPDVSNQQMNATLQGNAKARASNSGSSKNLTANVPDTSVATPNSDFLTRGLEAISSEPIGKKDLSISEGWVRISADKYKSLFPTTGIGHTSEDQIGVIDEDVGNLVDFLDTHAAINGGDAIISPDKRARNRFFRELRGRVLKGALSLKQTSGQGISLPFTLSIGDEFPDSEDRFQVKNQDGAILERRILENIGLGVWRYDLLKLGILLFHDHCPWNPAYDFEKKQFYLLVKTGQVVGNVYCKKKTDSDLGWRRIGVLVGK